VDFVKFATEHNFDHVVAWGEPTYVDWPSDTGDPKKDEKIRADVKKYPQNGWRIVFTPEGRWNLVNGEIVLVKPERRRKTR